MQLNRFSVTLQQRHKLLQWIPNQEMYLTFNPNWNWMRNIFNWFFKCTLINNIFKTILPCIQWNHQIWGWSLYFLFFKIAMIAKVCLIWDRNESFEVTCSYFLILPLSLMKVQVSRVGLMNLFLLTFEVHTNVINFLKSSEQGNPSLHAYLGYKITGKIL